MAGRRTRACSATTAREVKGEHGDVRTADSRLGLLDSRLQVRLVVKLQIV